MSPVCCPIFGSRCHSSSIVPVIRKTEVTRVVIFVVKRKVVHDACSGRGNVRLKRVSRLLSFLHTHFVLLPNKHEGMLVMAFSMPGICTGVNGHVLLMLRQRARVQTSLATMRDFFEAIFSTQLTVGKLLLNNATCLCAMSRTTVSTQSHSNNRPAISRSELVIGPPGLSQETRLSLMSFGHSKKNGWRDPQEFPQNNTSHTMARGINDPNVVRPSRHKIFAQGWTHD
jgi:hypothetical protein